MQIALQVIAFNVDPWINEMLKNADKYVDKIFIAYPPRPWGYSQQARESFNNPTKLESIDISNLDCEVEIVHGDWMYDEDTRNCLLSKAREQGYDWMVIQDADEFYTKTSWKRLVKAMKESTDADLLITPWFNFWKTPEYVIENRGSGIKCLNEGFAIRAKNSKCYFTFSRTSNAKNRSVIDEPCYHYGYVMSDASMKQKIQTWAHTKEISSMRQWYLLKWINWEENTLYLHPGSPAYWLKAVRFPLPQPEFAQKFIRPNINCRNKKGLCLGALDLWWNFRALTKWRVVQIKRLLRNTIKVQG